MDKTVERVARERLRGVADLMNNNLRFNVNNAMGTLVVQHHQASEMPEANVSLDGVTKGQKGRQLFNLKSTPLPIIHSDFSLTARHLAASRDTGQPIDTTQVEEATRSVTEKVEDILFNGLSSEDTLGFGSDTAQLQGYTNFSSRLSYTISDKWDDSAASGTDILNDVLSMIKLAHGARNFGPYMLYVPTNFWVKLMDDYKAESDKTIISRIRELPEILDVKPADKLSDDNVVLVQMSASTIDMVVGFEPMVVEWETQGGMNLEYKVMAIMVPRPKSDYNGNTGIVHAS
jgi:uncharacterized linocin/CFP29 family protein